MYILKKVRPRNLTSQNQLLKNIQNVDLTTTSIGENQMSGMEEPTSVYDDKGNTDPNSNPTTLPTIISLSTTISSYRSDRADSLQCNNIAVDQID